MTAQTPTPPQLPTGQQLFDAIMGNIEPELTSQGVKTLAEKYKDETPEQQLARRKRYETAYERYEVAYQQTLAMLNTQVDRYRRASYDKVEQDDRQADAGLFDRLSQAINA